jgi:hypothetical protein
MMNVPMQAGTSFLVQTEPRRLGRNLLASLKAELAFLRILVHTIDNGEFTELGAPTPEAGYIQLGNDGLDDLEFLRRQAIRSSAASIF